MPISIGTITSYSNAIDVNPINFTATVDSGCTLLLVFFNQEGSAAPIDPTSCFWDTAGVNEALTEFTSAEIINSLNQTNVFYLINPTAGASKNLRVNGVGQFRTVGVFAVCLSGTSGAPEAASVNSGTSVSTLSQAITTLTNGAMIFMSGNIGAGNTFTSYGTGQTERGKLENIGTTASFVLTSEQLANAGSDTQSYNVSASTNRLVISNISVPQLALDISVKSIIDNVLSSILILDVSAGESILLSIKNVLDSILTNKLGDPDLNILLQNKNVLDRLYGSLSNTLILKFLSVRNSLDLLYSSNVDISNIVYLIVKNIVDQVNSGKLNIQLSQLLNEFNTLNKNYVYTNNNLLLSKLLDNLDALNKVLSNATGYPNIGLLLNAKYSVDKNYVSINNLLQDLNLNSIDTSHNTYVSKISVLITGLIELIVRNSIISHYANIKNLSIENSLIIDSCMHELFSNKKTLSLLNELYIYSTLNYVISSKPAMLYDIGLLLISSLQNVLNNVLNHKIDIHAFVRNSLDQLFSSKATLNEFEALVLIILNSVSSLYARKSILTITEVAALYNFIARNIIYNFINEKLAFNLIAKQSSFNYVAKAMEDCYNG